MKKLRKKKLRLKRISFLLGIIIILGVIIWFTLDNKDKSIVKDNPVKETEKEESKEIVYTLSLVAAGDALIHDRLYNEAYNGSSYDHI